MAYLSTIEFTEDRRHQIGTVLKINDTPTILAYIWMDRDRRYFISTTSPLSEGKLYSQIRWIQSH